MSLLQIIENPVKRQWKELLVRPVYHTEGLNEAVCKILADIKERGDKAVNEYSLQFDKVSFHDPLVTDSELDNAEEQLGEKFQSHLLRPGLE